VRSSWLVEARQVALDSGDAVQAAEWKEEISQAVEKSLSTHRKTLIGARTRESDQILSTILSASP
jgi:hypothetical protein